MLPQMNPSNWILILMMSIMSYWMIYSKMFFLISYKYKLNKSNNLNKSLFHTKW